MKLMFKKIFGLLLFVLVLFAGSQTVDAALSKVPEAALTDEVISSANLKDEYYKVRTPLNESYSYSFTPKNDECSIKYTKKK